MTNDSRKTTATESADVLEALIRQRVRETIEAVLDEELTAALGAGRSDRVGAMRRGYRRGTRERLLTTSVGPTAITVPRARLRTAATPSEWQSTVVPRYQLNVAEDERTS